MARLVSRSCTCALFLALAVAHLAHAAPLSLTKACGGKLTPTCTTFNAISDATPVSWTVEAGTTEQVVVVRFAGIFSANVYV